MKLHLVNARISFANGLFNKSAFEPGQKEKYGADFIIEPDTKILAIMPDGTKKPITLKEAELAVANEAWKGKGKEMLEDLEASKKAIRNGNKRRNKDGDIYDGYEDRWYVTAKNETRPTVLNRDKSPLTEEDGVIYSGCRVFGIVELYANTKSAKKGLFAALKGVQFMKDDVAFGGGGVAKNDEFDEIEGSEDDEAFA